MNGKWHDFFGNNNPITLELACGGGEYTINLAKENPTRNFIGVDIKGARIWKGAQGVLEEKLPNVAFLRTRIEVIEYFFDAQEIEQIWITFPDPHLREAKAQKRLTSDRFLAIYRKFLQSNGIIRLKTDDPTLYEFTVETANNSPLVDLLESYDDIYSLPALPNEDLEIKTYYEGMHLGKGKTIKYVVSKLQ